MAGDRGTSSVQGRGLTADMGTGHGAERTLNMVYMVVTLVVSKLSGWLNADACCRVERGAYGAARGAGQQGATASSVQGRLDCRLGATEQAWSASGTSGT